MTDVELTVSVGRSDPSAFRLVATLTLTAMLSGFALAGVYQITKPTIDANRARELREGVFRVVPGSTQLRRFVMVGGALVPALDEQDARGPVVHAAYDDAGRFLAWALDGSGPGFQDTIHVLYGFDPTRARLTGMHILQSRETPGLGDKIYKDQAFVDTFDGLAPEPAIVVVKDGRDADNEVDAITGATISSRAVVKIINTAYAWWEPQLPPTPPAQPVAEGDDE